MGNSPFVRSALAQTALELLPPIVREAIVESAEFREDFNLIADEILSLGDSGLLFHWSDFLGPVRRVLSGSPEQEVVKDTDGREWDLKRIEGEGGLPIVELFGSGQRIHLPRLAVLAPSRCARLGFLDREAAQVNLPAADWERWRGVLTGRALEPEEIDAFQSELDDTPVAWGRVIGHHPGEESIRISDLVPPSRKYFERLVGRYDGSGSIGEYAATGAKPVLQEWAQWRPVDGFLHSLILTSHGSMSEEVEVDHLSTEDLLDAYAWLMDRGDSISRVGAIEVGLRILSTRPEIEPPLVELLEMIRDDRRSPGSGVGLLSALFCLVDGELARLRLFAAEPPFYRRLAALSHAALIQRHLALEEGDCERFSEWALGARAGEFVAQSLVDVRLEPNWDFDFAAPSQMAADFIGRILLAGRRYENSICNSEVREVIFGGSGGRFHSLKSQPYPWFPGPLEGTEGIQRDLPAEAKAAIEGELAGSEGDASSFVRLMNFCILYRIGREQAELAAKEIKLARHRLGNLEDRTQLIDVLKGLAFVAAVSRSPDLADEVRLLVRRYRLDPEFRLSIPEVIRIAVVTAASRRELREWVDFLGDWLTEVAFGDLEEDEADQLGGHVRSLCHVVPDLWVTCGRADAAVGALVSR